MIAAIKEPLVACEVRVDYITSWTTIHAWGIHPLCQQLGWGITAFQTVRITSSSTPSSDQVRLMWYIPEGQRHNKWYGVRSANINIHQSQSFHSSCAPNHRMPAQPMVHELSEKGSTKKGGALLGRAGCGCVGGRLCTYVLHSSTGLVCWQCWWSLFAVMLVETLPCTCVSCALYRVLCIHTLGC